MNGNAWGPVSEQDPFRMRSHYRLPVAVELMVAFAGRPDFQEYVRDRMKDDGTLALTVDMRGATDQWVYHLPPQWLASSIHDISLNVFPSAAHDMDAQKNFLRQAIRAIRPHCPGLITMSITWRVPTQPNGQSTPFPWDQPNIAQAVSGTITPLLIAQRVPNRFALHGIRFSEEDDEPTYFLEALVNDGAQKLFDPNNVAVVQLEMIHCPDSTMIVPTDLFANQEAQTWS